MRGQPATNVVERCLIGLLAITAACNLLGLLGPEPGVDESVFLVIGRDSGGGALPYRDFWDHKGPGIYAVTWALTHTGLPLGLMRAVCGAAWLAALWALWRSVSADRRDGFLVPGLLAVATVLNGRLEGQWIMTEPWEAAFVALGVASALAAGRAGNGRTGALLDAAAGGALVVAAVFRFTAALYCVPILALVIAERPSAPRTRLTRCLAVAGGAALAVAAAAAGLAALGILSDCVRQSLLANARVSGAISLREMLGNWESLAGVLPFVGFALLAACVGWSSLRDLRRPETGALVLLVAIGAVEALLPRKPYAHYLLPAAYLAMPLAWAGIDHLRTEAPRVRDGVLAFLSLAVLLQLGLPARLALDRVVHAVRPAPALVEGIPLDSIRVYLAPGDRVWSAGTVGAQLYWATGCRSATRYLYTGGGAGMGGNLDAGRIVGDLRATPPACVVVGPEWIDPDGGLSPACPPEVAAYLREQFDVVLTGRPPGGGTSVLCVRRSDLTGSPGGSG